MPSSKNILTTHLRAVVRSSQQKSRQFTLLELLVVISIIATLTGVLGFGIRHIVEQQRFYSAVQRVSDEVRTAYTLMFVLQSDFTLHFTKQPPNAYSTELTSLTPLTLQSKRLLDRKGPINGIASLRFVPKEGPERVQEGKQEEIELFFSTLNNSQPVGRLLVTSKAGEEKTIELSGFPFPAEKLDSETYFPPEVREHWTSNK